MQWIQFEAGIEPVVRDAERQFRLDRQNANGSLQFGTWGERASPGGTKEWRVDPDFIQYLKRRGLPIKLV